METTDGFELAEVDLELRGEGQLLGTRQSGWSDLRFTKLRVDRDLIERARALGHHTILASVSADQEASLALHRAFGFVECGRFLQLGYKFDRWIDVVYLQRMV